MARLLGVGTTSPQKKLHILQSGGGSAGNSNSVAVFENSLNSAGSGNAINLVTSASQRNYIYFGCPGTGATTSKGRIAYDNPNNWLYFGTNSAEVRMLVDAQGKVGIGTGLSTPTTALDVNGIVSIRTFASLPPPINSIGFLFVGNVSTTNSYTHGGAGTSSGLFCSYNSTRTRLSSHADPREVDAQAVTSFADTKVDLPFSFTHTDALIGKGQVVDMSKMISFVEKKMKSELGEQAGKLTYTFDMPASDTISLDKYEQAQAFQQAQRVLDKIEQMSWIKVPLGAEGRVPDEAFVEVPVYETVMQKQKVSRKELDLKSRRVVTVVSDEDVPTQVATGGWATQLRPNYRFEDGELYRKPTINDINVDALLADAPQIPTWILDRIHAGRQVGMDVKTLSDQIRRLLAEKTSESTTDHAAIVNK